MSTRKKFVLYAILICVGFVPLLLVLPLIFNAPILFQTLRNKGVAYSLNWVSVIASFSVVYFSLRSIRRDNLLIGLSAVILLVGLFVLYSLYSLSHFGL